MLQGLFAGGLSFGTFGVLNPSIFVENVYFSRLWMPWEEFCLCATVSEAGFYTLHRPGGFLAPGEGFKIFKRFFFATTCLKIKVCEPSFFVFNHLFRLIYSPVARQNFGAPLTHTHFVFASTLAWEVWICFRR